MVSTCFCRLFFSSYLNDLKDIIQTATGSKNVISEENKSLKLLEQINENLVKLTGGKEAESATPALGLQEVAVDPNQQFKPEGKSGEKKKKKAVTASVIVIIIITTAAVNFLLVLLLLLTVVFVDIDNIRSCSPRLKKNHTFFYLRITALFCACVHKCSRKWLFFSPSK